MIQNLLIKEGNWEVNVNHDYKKLKIIIAWMLVI
jgi:hypothetical protein